MTYKFKRYEQECGMLSYLAKRQLNLEKNMVKPDFDTYDLHELFKLLKGEMDELEKEIYAEDFNVERCLLELGDCAAYMVGLLVKISIDERIYVYYEVD